MLSAGSLAFGADPASTDLSAGPLQEVIVTAQYRKENLQDTPIAITAVSGARLEEQGIRDVADLGNIVPNANFIPSTQGPFAAIGMRGVNTSDFIPTTDPGVGVYIDDVYVGTLSGSALDLLDLDRVEVLRGPQGTLFGKNSLGGAIRMFSRQPKGTDTGDVEVTSGSSHCTDRHAVRPRLGGFQADRWLSEGARFCLPDARERHTGTGRDLPDLRAFEPGKFR
jgi:iron complex outermembrane receptor protein